MTELLWYTRESKDMVEHLIRFFGEGSEEKIAKLRKQCAPYMPAKSAVSASRVPESLVKVLLKASEGSFRRNVSPQMRRTFVSRLESAFVVLSTLIVDTDSEALVEQFCDIVSGRSTGLTKIGPGESALRLKILVNFYNSKDEIGGAAVARSATEAQKSRVAKVRFHLIRQIIDFACKTNQMTMLGDFLQNVENILTTNWILDTVAKRNFFKQLADAFAATGDDKSHLEFAVKYLQTFEKSNDKVDGEDVIRIAKGVIGGVLRNMDARFGSRVVHLRAVRQLKEKAEHLFELLRIIVFDDIGAYKRFYSKNKQYMDTVLNVDNAKAEKCMRIFSLCSLAVDSDKIKYADIAKKLELDCGDDEGKLMDEVEKYVLQGMQTGLLNARIDQHAKVVFVRTATQRSFGPEQWKSVQKKLHLWRSETAKLLETLKRGQDQQRQDQQRRRGGGFSRR